MMSDKTKNYLGWALIIAVLVLAYSAWSYVRSYSQSIEPSSFRSFAVSGEGKAVVVPDIAQFTFSVITEGGKDIGKLQTDNTTKVNKAIGFLKDKGINAKDIKTEAYNLEPRHQASDCGRIYRSGDVCPPPIIVGYLINQTVSVKIRDFKLIGDVLSGVVSNGANSVSQLNFTLDDPASAENVARTEAIAKAKEKAALVARAGGFDVGRLLGIEEGGYLPQVYYAKGAAVGMVADIEAAPAPTIEPGSQEVRVSVTLRYEID